MKVNRFLFFSFLVFQFFSFSVIIAQEWEELRGEHFIAYFIAQKDNAQAAKNFAKNVLEKAEKYYQGIASELNYQRFNFWLWEKRVKIYIYPDHESFLKATAQPQWSQGMADYTNKQIISFAWSRGFVESLLPHEIAHLIFRDFVGFKGEVPLWLDEGVAQWEQKEDKRQIKALAYELYQKDKLLLLSDLTKLDIRNFKADSGNSTQWQTRKNTGGPGVLFLNNNELVNTYYLEAVSLVGFLIERFGADSFTEFCRALRDGKALEEALRSAYPDYIRNLGELENKWREYLKEGNI